MPGFALLMLQVAAATAAPSSGPDERLIHPVPPERCNHSGTEIVVCAKDQDAYRLHGSGPRIEPTMPAKAEWRLFGDTKMSAHAEERSVGGFSAPAAMVTVTVPF